MALMLIEGFDNYGSSTALRRSYAMGDTPLFALGYGGIGQAISLDDWNDIVYLPIHPLKQNTDTITMGFHWYQTGVYSLPLIYVRGYLGSVELTLNVTSGGELQLERGTTTQLEITSGLGLALSTWYYIEFQFLVDDTVGLYEVKVDGVSVLSGTNVDTRYTSGANVDIGMVEIRGSYGEYRYDNLYILDDSGSTNNDFLGPVQVSTLYPDGDGATHTDFTPLSGTNYEMVDDGATPDLGTTYNASSTVNHIDQFTVGGLPSGDVGTIYGVQQGFSAWLSEPGARQMRNSIRVSSTDYEGDVHYIGPEYSTFYRMMETDPDTASAWLRAAVEAAEYGYLIEA